MSAGFYTSRLVFSPKNSISPGDIRISCSSRSLEEDNINAIELINQIQSLESEIHRLQSKYEALLRVFSHIETNDWFQNVGAMPLQHELSKLEIQYRELKILYGNDNINVLKTQEQKEKKKVYEMNSLICRIDDEISTYISNIEAIRLNDDFKEKEMVQNRISELEKKLESLRSSNSQLKCEEILFLSNPQIQTTSTKELIHHLDIKRNDYEEKCLKLINIRKNQIDEIKRIMEPISISSKKNNLPILNLGSLTK